MEISPKKGTMSVLSTIEQRMSISTPIEFVENGIYGPVAEW